MPSAKTEYWYKADGSLVGIPDVTATYCAIPKGCAVATAAVPVADKPAAPTLTSLTPNTAPIAQSGLTVTLTGTGFSSNCVVTAAGTTTRAAFISSTSMQATVTAAAPGVVAIVVRDDYGQAPAALNFTFT